MKKSLPAYFWLHLIYWAAACDSGGTSPIPSWEEYKAAATKEFQGHTIYVTQGDIAISLDELQAEYHRLVHQLEGGGDATGVLTQESTVNVVNGHDDLWTAAQSGALTYCISDEFGSRKGRAVSEMARAAADWEWEGRGKINFEYVPSQDASCSNANSSIAFSVRPWNSGGACAFFPSGGGCVARTVVIDFYDLDTNGGYGAVTSLGVFRHELGHVLGFRHEHIRVAGTSCYESANWRALTSYDGASDMHYPWCPGASNVNDLKITDLDAQGAHLAYPPVGVVHNNPTHPYFTPYWDYPYYYALGHRYGDTSILRTTADYFCKEKGFAGSNEAMSTYQTYGTGHTWVEGSSWKSSGGQSVLLVTSLLCTNNLPPSGVDYINRPSRLNGSSSYRLGYRYNDASVLRATANQYCVENGFARSHGSIYTTSSYGDGQTWFEGGVWKTTGGQPVTLIDKLRCSSEVIGP